MKRLTKWMLFTILPTMLISFSSCSNNVVDITTVSGPNLTQCGGFDWKVKFELKESSGKGGWLVQEIAVVQVVQNCDGTLNQTVSAHYWEAWEVKANKDIPHLRDSTGVNFDDNYRMPDRGRTFGATNAVGIIKYFENVSLPPTMKRNNAKTYAGILHADVVQPPFWNTEEEKDDHNFKIDWNCCINPPTKSYESVPIIGGIEAVPDKEIKTKSTISKMINSSPAWTLTCGDEEGRALIQVAKSISEYSKPEIRDGIEEFISVIQNRNDYVDQASKVYLVLRAIYDLPESIPIEQVKSYGGWVRHSTTSESTDFDLQYPLRYNPENQSLTFIGQFDGYLGAEYDALGEFDYFDSNFVLRDFAGSK